MLLLVFVKAAERFSFITHELIIRRQFISLAVYIFQRNPFSPGIAELSERLLWSIVLEMPTITGEMQTIRYQATL